MKLLCRLAEPEDHPEILDLQALSLNILLAQSLQEDVLNALIEHQRQERFKRDEMLLVATCNHQIVGFVAFLWSSSQITGLFIHPDFVRLKIGTELLNAAIELLETKRHRAVYVWSSEYAKPFYRQQGFQLLYGRYLPVARHVKVRVFWMRKSLYTPTVAEQRRNLIALIILGVLVGVSLWAAIAQS